jgi:hypothetical protein
LPLARLLKRLAEVSAVLAFIAVLMAGGAALYAWLGPENGSKILPEPQLTPQPQLTEEQVWIVLSGYFLALIEAESGDDGPASLSSRCYRTAKKQAIPKYENGLWKVSLVTMGDPTRYGRCWNGVRVYYVADDTGLVTAPTPTPGPSPTPTPTPGPSPTPKPTKVPPTIVPSPTPPITADDAQATLFNTLMACLNGFANAPPQPAKAIRAKWKEGVIQWPLQPQDYNYAGRRWPVTGPGFAYDSNGNLGLVTGQWAVHSVTNVRPADPASQLFHDKLC